MLAQLLFSGSVVRQGLHQGLRTSRVVPFLVTNGSESGVWSLTENASAVGSPPASFDGILQPGNGAAQQGDAVRLLTLGHRKS